MEQKDNIVEIPQTPEIDLMNLTPSNEALRQKSAEAGESQTSAVAGIGSMYDVNKELIKQTMKPLSQSKLKEKEKAISHFCNTHNNDYYMLLNNELKYFTLFKVKDKKYNHYDKLANEVIDIFLTDFSAKFYAIEPDENKVGMEIWVEIEDDIHMFLLFPYDNGLITV